MGVVCSTSTAALKYSPKGTLLAQIESQAVVIYDADSAQEVARLNRSGVQVRACVRVLWSESDVTGDCVEGERPSLGAHPRSVCIVCRVLCVVSGVESQGDVPGDVGAAHR